MRKGIISIIVFVILTLCMSILPGAASAASVPPVYYEGIPDYTGYDPQYQTQCFPGYDFGFRIDFPTPGGSYQVVLPNGIVDPQATIQIGTDGTYFSWASSLSIDAVIVKAGSGVFVYFYNPESFGDTDLNGPINPRTNDPYEISWIEFCFDYEMKVDKVARTSFQRDYLWTIEKTADQTDISMAVGEQSLVNYMVTVNADPQDSNWEVRGDIIVHNPAPFPVLLTSVTDIIQPDGIPALVDAQLPVLIPPKTGWRCGYKALLASAAPRRNTATVTTEPVIPDCNVHPITAVLPFDFSNALINYVDEQIEVNDTLTGVLGNINYFDYEFNFPYSFNYSYMAGPYAAAGSYTVENTASFVTNDKGKTGSDNWLVNVTVTAGVTVYTRTLGYWKTHSSYGPAPYDEIWASIGEDTPFFMSGASYYEVLQSATRGNAYYILAHQYIAAELNICAGADTPAEVDVAMASAEALFETYTPDEVAAMKGKNGKEIRAQFIALAELLDSYNNGEIGPGHCPD